MRREKKNGVINKEYRNQRGPVKGNSNDPKQEGWGSCQGVSKDLMHGKTRDAGDQSEGNKQVHDEGSRVGQQTLQVILVQERKS